MTTDDREQRIQRARAALQKAASEGVDLEAMAHFLKNTTPAERVARADTSVGGMAAAEEMAYLMDDPARRAHDAFFHPKLRDLWEKALWWKPERDGTRRLPPEEMTMTDEQRLRALIVEMVLDDAHWAEMLHELEEETSARNLADYLERVLKRER